MPDQQPSTHAETLKLIIDALTATRSRNAHTGDVDDGIELEIICPNKTAHK